MYFLSVHSTTHMYTCIQCFLLFCFAADVECDRSWNVNVSVYVYACTCTCTCTCINVHIVSVGWI